MDIISYIPHSSAGPARPPRFWYNAAMLNFLRKYSSPEYADKFALYGADNFVQYRLFRLRNKLSGYLPFYRTVAARAHQKKFAHVMPIGVNCETAFRFYRKWKFLDSSLFAWANARNLETLTKSIGDLSTLMTGPARLDPKTHMWICGNTNIGFHGKLEAGATYTPEEEAADLADLRGRTEHLKQKFLKALQSEQPALLVHRLSAGDMSAPDLGARLDALQATLAKLDARNYTLLVVCEKPFLAKMPPGPNRVFRAVNVFNALDHAADKNVGDAVGWLAVFTEFAPAKILPKAHKFKFE